MKKFEMSSKEAQDGMRDFSLVLHEIYPESTFSEDGTGSQTNANGIAWREKWTEKNKNTLINKSVRVEFLNDERSEIGGHGFTGYSADAMPRFEDATVIGHFTGAEIQDITYDDGTIRRVLVGKGVCDAMCYPELIEALENDYLNGNPIHGSVEIMKDGDHDSIVYENGYHEDSRTPQDYLYSGYAILAIKEADPSAILLEINENKEDLAQMTDVEIKALIEQVLSELNNSQNEINSIKEDCARQIAEANAERDAAISERNEVVASSEALQSALDKCQADLEETYKKLDELYEERKALEDSLGEALARERVNEMNNAIANFTDEEREYAREQIDAFTANPMSVEINSIVDRIWIGIGQAAKSKEEQMVTEINSAEPKVEDIFSGVETADQDVDIY